jgi:hypothetical protein
LVAASAELAFLTLASALYTAACAVARVAAVEVVLVVPVEEPPTDGAVVDVLGAVVAVGVAGCVVVVWGVVVVVVAWGVVVVVVAWVVDLVAVADTNTVVPEPEPVSRLAVVAVELVVDVAFACAVLSWAWAAVRFCSAWASASCADVASSSASS